MQTDLSTLIAKPAEPKATQINTGKPIDDEVKLEAILSLAELMEKGTRSTSAIQAWLATTYDLHSRNTAIKYRNLAMVLIARENKPMSRENWRHLEVGRLSSWIERLTNRITTFEDNAPKVGDPDYIKWHDSYAKLLSKLNDFAARLHAITGLNEITINTVDERKRVIFLRPGENMTESHNVTEGEVIQTELSTTDGGTA